VEVIGWINEGENLRLPSCSGFGVDRQAPGSIETMKVRETGLKINRPIGGFVRRGNEDIVLGTALWVVGGRKPTMRGKTQRGGFVALSVCVCVCGGKGQEERRRMDGTPLVKKERSLRQKRSEETLNNAVGDTRGFISIMDGIQTNDETYSASSSGLILGCADVASPPHTGCISVGPNVKLCSTS
jgi:hypothetical protein